MKDHHKNLIFTQSQSATVYFFCTISYTVAVCDCVFLLYDFLHSRSLRLCISSVRFLKLGGSPNLFLSCDFFLLSSHNLHLLPHAWSDFDQTWSEWPVGKWLQKLCFVWPRRSCRGHRGQKCHFFTENVTPPSCFIGFLRHLIRMTSE